MYRYGELSESSTVMFPSMNLRWIIIERETHWRVLSILEATKLKLVPTTHTDVMRNNISFIKQTHNRERLIYNNAFLFHCKMKLEAKI